LEKKPQFHQVRSVGGKERGVERGSSCRCGKNYSKPTYVGGTWVKGLKGGGGWGPEGGGMFARMAETRKGGIGD